MKMLIISFVFWILIIPSLVASFLILTALSAFVPTSVFRCCLVWNRLRRRVAALRTFLDHSVRTVRTIRALSTQRVRTAVAV